MVLFLLLYFSIYSVKFIFLPIQTFQLLFSFFFLFEIYTCRTIFNKNTISLISLFLFYIISVTIISKSLTLDFVKTFVLSFVLPVSFCYMLINYYDNKKILKNIYFVILLQSIFILLTFVFPALRFSFQSLIIFEESSAMFLRSPGFTTGASATLSIIQSIGVIIGFYYLMIAQKVFYKILYSILFLLIIASVCLTGRSGLAFLIVVFIIAILFFRNKKFYHTILFKISTLVFLFSLFFLFPLSYEILYNIEKISYWITSEFNFSGKSIYLLNTLEKQIFKNHFFLPSDFNNFLVGDTSTWNAFRIPSDSGYIRLLHSVGIFGVLIFFSILLLNFYYFQKRFSNRTLKYYSFLVFIVFLLFNIKEPFFLKHSLVILFILIFSCTGTKRFTFFEKK